MSGEEEWRQKVERELGELKVHTQNAAADVAEIKRQQAEFLKEERDEHQLINTRIGELHKLVSEFLLTAKVSNRLKMIIVGVFGTAAGGAILRALQAFHPGDGK